MTREELGLYHLDGLDIIQPEDFMLILLIAIGIFVLIQIVNGIMNILTARQFKKMARREQEIRDDDARLMSEQWEEVIRKFSDIVEMNIETNEKLDYLESYFDDLREASEVIDQAQKIKTRKRGPYAPRKPKVIEHKMDIQEKNPTR